MEAANLSIAFVAGIFAGFIGSMAGGGGLISIPCLILLGVSPHVAIATHRAGAVGLQLGALVRFVQAKEFEWRYVVPLSILSLIAAPLGSRLLLKADESTLKGIVVVAMLTMLPVILIKRDIGLANSETSASRKAVGFAAFFLVLLWQAFFGPAAATMTFYVMMFCFGMSINRANATVKLPGLLLGISSLLIFAVNGIVNWTYGISLFSGMLIGGYLGAHTALTKGNAWVKVLFTVIVLLSAARMILESIASDDPPGRVPSTFPSRRN